jgi:hypothetical protein
MTSPEAEGSKLNAFAPFVLAALFGSAATADWMPTPGSAALVTWLGSAVAGLVGTAGILFAFRRVTLSGGWTLVAFGVVLDWLLTLLLIIPVKQYGITDPLGPWPYVLGSLATFIAGAAMGLLAPRAPLTFASAMVSVDLLVTGAVGILQPQALTARFLSRIVVAYTSACLGAIVGRNALLAFMTDRNSVGRFLATTILQIATAGVGGAVTVFLLKYVGA